MDDELIGSRAGDVETKTLSCKKAGKDGPVADCVADSLLSIVLGMRLRVKGEKQQENVENLLDTLPKLTSTEHSVEIAADRGYAKLPFVMTVLKMGYEISTIANLVGSRHPFLLTEDVEALKTKWSANNEP